MAHHCENCKFKAHYDKKPNSMLGKFWHWRFLTFANPLPGCLIELILQVMPTHNLN